ncbi:MAG: thiamine-phosphate kinase [Acidobacteriaceae bacterium]
MAPRTQTSLTELTLIQQIRTQAAGQRSKAVTLGIGDDCAILQPPAGQELLVTTDFSLENRHFRRASHTPESIGHRCLARGLSDLAAMGAQPLAAFLSLAVPAERMRGTPSGPAWVEEFFHGLLALASKHHTPLAGGDTSQSPADLALADIILLGSAPRGKSLRRSGARPGDFVYVTGALGGAAAELAALEQNPRRFAGLNSDRPGHPHFFPQPRLAVGQALLRRRLATACIDLSDGLSTDLGHICEESHVAAEIDEQELPIHPLAIGQDQALHFALHGGEDYELLFTAPAKLKIPAQIAGVPITRMGRITSKQRGRPTMSLISADGKRRPLKPAGWEHFRNTSRDKSDIGQ